MPISKAEYKNLYCSTTMTHLATSAKSPLTLLHHEFTTTFLVYSDRALHHRHCGQSSLADESVSPRRTTSWRAYAWFCVHKLQVLVARFLR